MLIGSALGLLSGSIVGASIPGQYIPERWLSGGELDLIISGAPAAGSLKDPLKLAAIGKAFYIANKIWKAKDYFSCACAFSPEASKLKEQTSLWLALCLGRSQEVLNAASQARKKNAKPDKEDLLLRAYAERQQMRFASSVLSCREILASDPDNFPAFACMSASLSDLKASRALRETAVKMSKQFPRSAYCLEQLSFAYFLGRDFRKADELISKALMIAPANIDYMSEKAACRRFSCSMGLKQVLDEFDRDAAKLAPESKPEFELSRAKALWRMGEYAAARPFLDALANYTNDPYILLVAAGIYLDCWGNSKTCADLIDRAARLMKNPALSKELKASLNLKERSSLKEKEASLRLQASKLDPLSPDLAVLLAKDWQKQGKYLQAVSALSKPIDQGIGTSSLLAKRAYALAQAKEFEKAGNDYTNALIEDPWLTGAELQLISLPQGFAPVLLSAITNARKNKKIAQYYMDTFDLEVWNKLPAHSPSGQDLIKEAMDCCRSSSEFLRLSLFFQFFADWKKAYEIDKRALAQFPQDDRVLVAAATDALHLNKAEEALTYAQKAAEIAPERPDALVCFARVLRKAGRKTDSDWQIKKALQIDPDSCAALGAAIEFAESAQGSQAAFKRLEESYRRCPANSQMLGMLLWQSAAKRKLLPLALEMIELDPNDANGYLVAFDCYLSLGQTLKCRTLLEKAREAGVWGASFYLKQGLLANLQSDYKGAIDLLTLSLSDPGSRKIALRERAYSFYKLGNFDASLKDLNSYISEQPDNDPSLRRAYQTRAKVQLERRDFAKAIQDYTEAISHSKFPDADYLRRAEAYFSRGKLKEAESDLNKSLKGNFANGRAHYLKSRILHAQGKQKEATAELKLAERFDYKPDSEGKK